MIQPISDQVHVRKYYKDTLSVDRSHLLAYWPLWEASGAIAYDISGNSRNGAHANAPLNNHGINDGRNCPYYDGSTSYTNIYSASIAAAFNGDEGTVSLWGKVSSAGIWADATTRYLFMITSNSGTNLVGIFRPVTNNLIWLRYTAGGTAKTVQATIGPSIAWFHLALTWSKSADQVKAYVNGSQVGTTQTGLGIWAGVPSNGQTVIGASTSTPSSVFSGYLAHVALWNVSLSAPSIARLARVRQ